MLSQENSCYKRHSSGTLLYMPTRSSKDHDFVAVARRVVEQAIGEHLDGTPLEDPDAGKNPHAVALGRLGGQKGGVARAKRLSGKKRTEIARKAAMARWRK
jgi:hypothetical protein